MVSKKRLPHVSKKLVKMRRILLQVWHLLGDSQCRLLNQQHPPQSMLRLNSIRLYIVHSLNLSILMNLKLITLGQMLSTQRYLNLQRQVLLNNTEVASLRFFVLPILKNSHFYSLVPMQSTSLKHLAQL